MDLRGILFAYLSQSTILTLFSNPHTMRYIISLLLAIASVASLGFTALIAPVGAVTSTVSGEVKTQVSPTQIKKALLNKKIRIAKLELAKTTTALVALEKKLANAKSGSVLASLFTKRIATLQAKQSLQQTKLTKLEAELALIR